MPRLSLQDKYAPKNACFGCGPSNKRGLRIKTFVKGNETVAHWKPQRHHEAFPGVLNGGIVGALLDCHSNWTAAWYLMKEAKVDHPPCTVTAEFNVKLLRPTPTKKSITLLARVVDAKEDRATVEAELHAEGKLCATCRGLFISVEPGHPAYYRW